jgi:hypothetical protein
LPFYQSAEVRVKFILHISTLRGAATLASIDAQRHSHRPASISQLFRAVFPCDRSCNMCRSWLLPSCRRRQIDKRRCVTPICSLSSPSCHVRDEPGCGFQGSGRGIHEAPSRPPPPCRLSSLTPCAGLVRVALPPENSAAAQPDAPTKLRAQNGARSTAHPVLRTCLIAGACPRTCIRSAGSRCTPRAVVAAGPECRCRARLRCVAILGAQCRAGLRPSSMRGAPARTPICWLRTYTRDGCCSHRCCCRPFPPVPTVHPRARAPAER